jgi:hypothetical protein
MTTHQYIGVCRLRDGRKMKFELGMFGDDHTQNILEAQKAIADHVGQARVGTILIGLPCLLDQTSPGLVA